MSLLFRVRYLFATALAVAFSNLLSFAAYLYILVLPAFFSFVPSLRYIVF